MSMHPNHLEGLFTYRVLGPTPGISDSATLGWNLKNSSSDKFSEDADGYGPGTTPEDPML